MMSEVVPTTNQATEDDPTMQLALGKRDLALKNYNAAVESLACACQGLAEVHGEAADECADAYYYYGKALLLLAREESGVFGDKMPGAQNPNEQGEEDDDDEDEDEEEGANGETETASKANGGSEATANVDSTTSDKEPVAASNPDSSDSAEAKPACSEMPDSSATKSSTSKVESGDGDGLSEQPGTSNCANGDESVADLDNDADVDNLQLAWEMLDLARSIYEKRLENSGGDVVKERLSEVHLNLGEVALESETYDKAVVDLLRCLELQKELYKSDDRRIAETHYHIGLANSLASNFEDAIIHFKNSANIIQTRIKSLGDPALMADDAFIKKYKPNDPNYTIENEIKELQELLPEIHEKIQDMMDYKAETIKRVRESLGLSNGEGASSSSVGAGSSKSEAPKQAASDISHLIKRKRKSSGSDTGASAAKKPTT